MAARKIGAALQLLFNECTNLYAETEQFPYIGIKHECAMVELVHFGEQTKINQQLIFGERLNLAPAQWLTPGWR